MAAVQVYNLLLLCVHVIPATSKRVPSSNIILLACEKIGLVYHTYLSLETAVKSISPSVKPRVRFQNRINRYEYYCIILYTWLRGTGNWKALYLYSRHAETIIHLVKVHYLLSAPNGRCVNNPRARSSVIRSFLMILSMSIYLCR